MDILKESSVGGSTASCAMTPGRFLQQRRHKGRLTPRQLAEQIRVHRTAVYHWEADRARPRQPEAVKLADVLCADGTAKTRFLAAFGYCDPEVTRKALEIGRGRQE